MIRFAGIARLLGLSFAAHAAGKLPLADGHYNSASCAGRSNALTSIGLYNDVPSPAADDFNGCCMLQTVWAIGNVYLGSAPCNTGGRSPDPDGTYKFSDTVLNSTAFISKGKTFAGARQGGDRATYVFASRSSFGVTGQFLRFSLSAADPHSAGSAPAARRPLPLRECP